MLKAIKRVLAAAPAGAREVSSHERRHLQIAVAVLLHEARRSDYVQRAAETDAAVQALGELFALAPAESAALLEQGREKAEQLTSFYAPVSVIKRDFSPEERIRLVEHLWRVAYADGRLDPHEDHYVRKIAHLLYVPNTQSMLARNRARPQP
ncbi:MAG TPA: TerB family tellurite resistance protein [Burkholderiales bacterium]|nr:TerB family tellurite resistance protein [Burkholderiales bacterium]